MLKIDSSVLLRSLTLNMILREEVICSGSNKLRGKIQVGSLAFLSSTCTF